MGTDACRGKLTASENFILHTNPGLLIESRKFNAALDSKSKRETQKRTTIVQISKMHGNRCKESSS